MCPVKVNQSHNAKVSAVQGLHEGCKQCGHFCKLYNNVAKLNLLYCLSPAEGGVDKQYPRHPAGYAVGIVLGY